MKWLSAGDEEIGRQGVYESKEESWPGNDLLGRRRMVWEGTEGLQISLKDENVNLSYER